jgi:bacitracin synthase 3
MKDILEFIIGLKNKSVSIQEFNGQLKVTGNIAGLSDNEKQEIKTLKPEILNFLQQNSSNKLSSGRINPAADSRFYPLSSSQRQLWILSQLEQGNAAYNMHSVYVFEGALDIPMLERSFETLIARHEILRTVFNVDENDRVSQQVYIPEELAFSIQQDDVRNVDNQQEYILSLVKANAAAPFKLDAGPLMRAGLYQTADNKWIFSYTMHHIISDGWSMDILIRELLTVYNAYTSGHANPLKSLRVHYKDYATWQQEQVATGAYTAHKSYWLQQLEGELPVLELPTDRPRPVVKSFNGSFVSKRFSKKLSNTFKSLVTEQGATLFMGLLAAINALMHQYSKQEDIIIGSPIAGREHPDLDGQIGFYLNTLALRTRFTRKDSYKKLLSLIRKATLGAYEYQGYPFEEVLKNLHLQRDRSRSPLFDVMVVLQNTAGTSTSNQQLGNLKISNYDRVLPAISKFDLTFEFTEIKEALHLNLNYNSDLYDRSTAVRITEHLLQLVEAITAHPEQAVEELDYLTAAEKEMLLVTFNENTFTLAGDKTLTALLEERIFSTPDHAAIVFEEKIITYRELNEKANQLAHYLQAHFAPQPDERIAIQLERSEWMIIAILGVLKAGAAYVPIDPGYPQHRIDYILSDSQCKTVIDEQQLETFHGEAHLHSTANPASANDAGHLAYIIYTSGSTGRPKGVMIPHRAIVNYLCAINCTYGMDSGDRVVQISNVAFDASVEQIMLSLSTGATLYIVPQATITDPEELGNYIVAHKITHLHTVPVLLEKLNLDGHALKRMVSAGENCPVALAEKYRNTLAFYNKYGPTEATVSSTIYHVTPQAVLNSVIPIGKPIHNSRIYILDDRQGLTAFGVPGEICISGTGLAQGYLNQRELTSEKFIPHPFIAGQVLYRTGDLGRWLSDGNIEYIGRKDDQVKIRGYRIELGEIESTLQGHEDIDAAVVTVKATADGNRELVAHLVGKKALQVPEIRAYLAKQLPSYMMPTIFVQLAALPLTANGKTDRKKLLDTDGLEVATGVEYSPPRNAKEDHLVAVYEEILKKQRVGIKDDFFMLGGDSIKSILVVSRLRQRGYTLTIGDILLYPVVEQLAGRMELVSRSIFQGAVEGLVRLTPVQASFFQQQSTDLHHYNQSVLLQSRITLAEEGLKAVLSKIMEHHDALRMVYRQTPEGWQQENKAVNLGYSLEVITPASQTDFLIHCERIQSSFDLENGPLFKAVLFRGQTGDRLLLVAHHLVIDGVSWRILFEDFSSLYQQYLAGEAMTLPLKTDALSYWQEQQAVYAESEALHKEEAYWSALEATHVQPLPVDHQDSANLMDDVTSTSILLEEDITTKLLTCCYKAYRTEVNDVLLTALGQTIQEFFGINKVMVKLEGHGRENIGTDIDITRTVGWFTTSYPVALDMGNTTDSIQQLIAVKESLHRIPNKGIGYGILRYMGDRNYKLNPEIIFNYLGDFGAGVKTEEGDALFVFSGESHGRRFSGHMYRSCLLTVSGMIVGGKLRLLIEYGHRQYEATTIKNLLDAYRNKLTALVEQLSATEKTYLTPVDLTYRDLSFEQVMELNENGIEDVYALSPLQEGLYYHWLASPDSPVYFEENSYRLKGNIDLPALEKSYQMLVARYGVLRTVFTEKYNSRLLQVIRKEVAPGFRILDAIGDEQFSLAAFRESDRLAGFDLRNGPMMRLTVVLLGEDTYEFIWSHHHILMDGWCGSILVKEFFQFYHSLVADTPLQLGKVYPYADYIKWLSGVNKAATLAYWKEYLSGYNTVTALPEAANGNNEEYLARQKTFYLEGTTRQAIKTLCAENGITENTFIQTMWSILLAAYNNTDDVVFGAVVSGRPSQLDGVEDMIGLFINAIPVRVQPKKDMVIRELLKAVQNASITSTDHHYTQLAEIQSVTEIGRKLFNHIVLFENYPVQEMVKQSMEASDNRHHFSLLSTSGFEQSSYDFMFTVAPGDRILIKMSYNGNLYAEQQMNQLQQHFTLLVEQVVKDPTVTVSGVNFLPEEERQQLLETFNNSLMDYSKEATLLGLFEQQFRKTPNNTAVVFEGNSITYRTLDEQATRLAISLTSNYDIKPDDLIGIMLDRSDKMIIAILGILKAGAAYVPIDPEYPEARKAYITEDTSINILITQSDFIFNLSYFGGTVFAIDIQLDTLPIAKDFKKPVVQPKDLAYVIYTSGSTGQPKGVMIEHQAIVNTIFAQQTIFGITSAHRGLQFASLSFDASVWEIFMMLCTGGALYIINEESKKTPALLEQFITDNCIDIATIPPAFLKLLEPSRISTLKHLITAGEAAIFDKAVAFNEYGNYYNAYGPTESSICASVFKLEKGTCICSSNIPIGTPIPNTRLYIVDSHNSLSPAGIAGELCIGGAGLARGYLNNPSLTAASFVDNPFKKGERMYKTGDLAKWLSDGNIAFIGRKDSQVKIRGYRIELGEIETALHGCKGISAAAVLTITDNNGEKDLVAYVSGEEGLVVADIRAYLDEILPAYMIPHHFVVMESLPLTTSGKIDRKNLPTPDAVGIGSGTAQVAPRNETEEKLLGIWQEILGKNNIGVKDDFFNLGGHSLKATRLAGLIHKEFEVQISLKELFSATVLEQQAAFIRQAQKTSFVGISPLAPQVSYELSASQSRLWVLSQFEEANLAYNMSGVYTFEGTLDIAAITDAFNALVNHHEILRTVFLNDKENSIRQFILSPEDAGVRLAFRDVQQYAAQESKLSEIIQETIERPFNLAKGPLLRATVHQISISKWIFAYAMHHIISDGWSMHVMIRELFQLYRAYLNKEANPLVPLPVQYKDYAAWQREQLSGNTLTAHKAYWQQQFEGELPVLELLPDKTRPVIKTYNGGVVNITLKKELAQGLKALAQEQGGTLFMGLLAAVNALLFRYTRQEDMIIGSPIAGREHADLENQIGFYVNMLALRSRFNGTDNFKTLLEKVKTTTLGGYEHQLYPFDDLVNDLKLERDMSRNALFDVVVVLQNTGGGNAMAVQQPDHLKIQPYNAGGKIISKFDLAFDFSEAGEDIYLSLVFNTDIYSSTTASRLVTHLKQLITAIVAAPGTAISELDYLSDTEKELLLNTFNDSAVNYPKNKSLVEQFETQTSATPNLAAVIFEKTILTYKELNEQANKLANYLRASYNLKPNELVGIKLERNEWLIITILGILKSGAAYVPIDPAYPQERIDYMVADSQCKLLIDNTALDSFKCVADEHSPDNLLPVNTPSDLAYVIYTSGSTGKPKGVMIEHGTIANTICSQRKMFDIHPEERGLQFASASFDASVWEIFMMLCTGGTLYIINEESKKTPALLEQFITDNRIDIATIPPGYLKLLQVDRIRSMKKLITAGESAVAELSLSFAATGICYNAYGPTESSICAAVYTINPESPPTNHNIPIGKPIANTQLYILDNNNSLVPVGVAGEICIGGKGLSRAYLNKPALTAEKFVPHPFIVGARIYKTGDLGRWLSDGNMEYLGRIDDQVKIRGYRIEMGEIESALQSIIGIEAAAVNIRSHADGEKELVAYLVSTQSLDVTDIKNALAKYLPAYMLPAYYVQLSQLPLNANGKVDRKKLLYFEGLELTSAGVYEGPRNELDEKLVQIWKELLGKQQIGITDNFFEVGGNSMKIIKLSNLISTALDRNIPVALLFQYVNIKDLSDYFQQIPTEQEEKSDFDRNEILKDLDKFKF